MIRKNSQISIVSCRIGIFRTSTSNPSSAASATSESDLKIAIKELDDTTAELEVGIAGIYAESVTGILKPTIPPSPIVCIAFTPHIPAIFASLIAEISSKRF